MGSGLGVGGRAGGDDVMDAVLEIVLLVLLVVVVVVEVVVLGSGLAGAPARARCTSRGWRLSGCRTGRPAVWIRRPSRATKRSMWGGLLKCRDPQFFLFVFLSVVVVVVVVVLFGFFGESLWACLFLGWVSGLGLTLT